MKVVGLTGGIASGKSTVARLLAEKGAVVIDTDKIGHEALQSDHQLRRELIASFGEEILTTDGEIDRNKLGEIVFNDPKSLARLNQIMHPRLYDKVKAKLKEYQQQKIELVILEVPLLIEASWTSLVDKIWVTVASEDTLLKRLQQYSNYTARQALARIRAQMPTKERLKHADLVIDTDSSLDELKTKVTKQWREWMSI